MSKEIELKLRDIRYNLRKVWDSLNMVAKELNELEIFLKKKKCQIPLRPDDCEECY